MKSTDKKLAIILILPGLLFGCAGLETKKTSTLRGNEEALSIEQEIKKNPDLTILFDLFGDPNEMLARFKKGKQKIEEEWQRKQSTIKKIQNLGTTKTLEILPLIDWHTSKEFLKGVGVSYLVKTDKCTILFDLGLNDGQRDPSPLLRNMKQLGVTLDDFDAIVISHNHDDHVGGGKWSEMKTFSLTNHQINLGQKRVYTPVPMTYPGLTPIYAENPTVISEGVATLGVISNQLFFLGYTPEQTLAVSVDAKGIVLISGCGHQTLSKILERAEALFDEPIYGIIGGLHYPVTDSRGQWKGIKIQMYAGTGKAPWNPITTEEVQGNIDLLKKRNPGVVGLSGHDSCDASIEAFRRAFPEIYKDIKVGEKIVVGVNE